MSGIKLVKRIKYAGDVHSALMELGWDAKTAAAFLDDIPAVDAEKVCEQMGLVKEAMDMAKAYLRPVRHGRWIERLDGDGEFVHHMCSECKADAFFQYIIEADWDENIDGEWYNRGDEITGIEEFLTDYCPHCGARMDGDDDATKRDEIFGE